ATWLLRAYASRRLSRLKRLNPEEVQQGVLRSLVHRARGTRFALQHEFGAIRTLGDYRECVPIRTYEEFWDNYWRDSFPRLVDCTWPGTIPYFALSSGTTRGVTKYIPISREINRANARAVADLLVHHVENRPDSRVLAGRCFMLGGSTGLTRQARGVYSGDLSGIAAAVRPAWTGPRYFPPRHLEGIADWETKVERFARSSLRQDIRAVGGTPSWLLIYFDRLLEIAGDGDGRIASVYPDLELLIHGGVAWAPYRDRFDALLEGTAAETREVYPASEGFFGVADGADGAGLRLLLDNEIFYEFLPESDLGAREPDCRWIGDAEMGVNYALVISTGAGLWRYLVGDTVTLVSRDPPRVLVTGRTSYTLSAFGEHVIGAELERAVSESAKMIGATVDDFAVGSLFSERSGERGGHLFVVEFSDPKVDTAQVRTFATGVDSVLMRLNEDYAAHRADGWGLDPPRVAVLPPGGFVAWMKGRGKLGGQNKVPRVINDTELFGTLRKLAREFPLR
ncbi:MAG: GH3 auxin-responsive promoter family protein, partial [Rhodospirillales bacterium]|nr:GH3 auxin-responsive promoter family protein [Rhodospirillales bacterium]